MISLEHFLDAMARTSPDGNLPLNTDQLLALEHDYTNPLWMIAGPGTGKTHTLAWLVLKRVLVDGVPANRIVFTTFTRKAAAELESRLIVNRQKLIDAGLTEAEDVEISDMLVGTLHGLCSRVLRNSFFCVAAETRCCNARTWLSG
jgi:DNA helicase II / ATP-dependent DNA helicase PcrA